MVSLMRGCRRVLKVLVRLMKLPCIMGCPLSSHNVKVLDEEADYSAFVESLRGKNILHVKGFGSSKASNETRTPEQEVLEAEQQQEVVKAMEEFGPDYIAVDGDPFGSGSGFPKHIKAFVELSRKRGKAPPRLIWARSVAFAAPARHGGKGQQRISSGEWRRRVGQAREWATGLAVPVTVYWVDAAKVSAAVDTLYGQGTTASLEPGAFDARGLVKLLSSGGAEPPFVPGLTPALRASIAEVEDPARGDGQFFEKCSFENSAKGNVIFEELNAPGIAAHGVICVGGGESVLLELATMYMNRKSGFDAKSVAVFPHSRGKAGRDPKLPLHVGSAFGGSARTL